MNKYKKEYSVTLDDMDLEFYRLRPVAAIKYVQDAFARYTSTKRMAAYDLIPQNLYWVTTEHNMRFVDSLPFWSEKITVELWISEISKLKFYTDYRIFYNGKPFLEGCSCWLILDMNTKRPAKTDMITEKFEVCDEMVFGNHAKFIIPEKLDKVREIKHTMNLSDIDFNNHVNNKSYINIAEMTETEEFRKTKVLEKLYVKFNRETFLGDTLNCYAYKTSTPNNYIHNLICNDVSVCDIVTQWQEQTYDTNILEYPLKIKEEIV